VSTGDPSPVGQRRNAPRTAVVTGGARGIGRQIASKLAQAGFSVLLTGRDQSAVEAAAQAIGPRAWACAQDVRDPRSHRAVAEEASSQGRLEVWINNAGAIRAGKAWALSPDEVRLLVETNLFGVIWGCQAAVEGMRDGGGQIINVASMAGLTPMPGVAVYAATKRAVIGFTESLQGELNQARFRIRVHALCPEATATLTVAEHEQRFEPDAALFFSRARLLSPETVAERAVSLLDSRAIVTPLPRHHGALARLASRYPRLGLRAVALSRRRWIKRQVASRGHRSPSAK
jgi:short-subunit dehydrogenase